MISAISFPYLLGEWLFGFGDDGGGSGPVTPTNAYTAEDGTTLYTAEDGSTYYVQET